MDAPPARPGPGPATLARRRLSAAPPSHSLLDLPDDLLLAILAALDPLPDGFSAGRTCARLHRLMGCDSLKVRVSLAVPDGPGDAAPPAAATARAPRPAGRATFSTLAAAVAASRPGDTLLLDGSARGAVFDCPAIPITWPLRLAATGANNDRAAAPPPTLAASGGAPAALVFHASARVDGLAVLSSPTAGGACLDHRGGVLVIDGCSLEVLEPAAVAAGATTTTPHSRAPGLPFLHSPILSSARAPGAAVHVHETRLAGAAAGALAVRAPAGVVSGVRVIPQDGAGGDIFWLSVTAQAAAAALPWAAKAGGGGVTATPSVADLAARAKVWRAGRRRAGVVEEEEEGRRV